MRELQGAARTSRESSERAGITSSENGKSAYDVSLQDGVTDVPAIGECGALSDAPPTSHCLSTSSANPPNRWPPEPNPQELASADGSRQGRKSYAVSRRFFRDPTSTNTLHLPTSQLYAPKSARRLQLIQATLVAREARTTIR